MARFLTEKPTRKRPVRFKRFNGPKRMTGKELEIESIRGCIDALRQIAAINDRAGLPRAALYLRKCADFIDRQRTDEASSADARLTPLDEGKATGSAS